MRSADTVTTTTGASVGQTDSVVLNDKRIYMNEWIKWWKDKTFLTILATCLVAIVLAFVFARYISWGWIVSMLIGVLAGLFIRRVIIKRIEEGNDGLG